jgi:Zn-dependent peptidase ImmA (M78 family)
VNIFEAMRNEVNINPEILSWAISRAGKNVSELQKKHPQLSLWLSAEKKPTLRQIETFSRWLSLPLGYLFLANPPKEEIPFPFFRSTRETKEQVSLNVYDTILDIQKRQDWLSDYLRDLGEAPLDFVGKFNTNTNYLMLVEDIRNVLALNDNWAQEYRSWEDALKNLIHAIEEIGIIVILNGVVGNNNYRKIDVEECRGFVLVDEYSPFMFINNSDSKSAQMFTIVHELAHIWIGKSAGFDFKNFLPASDPIEVLCDKVAAEFLVPEIKLRIEWEQVKDYSSLSKFFKVSRIVIARRLLDLHLISRSEFFNFYNVYKQEVSRLKKSPGGNFYATQSGRVSVRFAGFVESAVRNNKISYRDAYKLTGLYGDTYHNFIQKRLG